MEMGALLAILFRLSSTFELIASTQRELRRTIRRERHGAELESINGFDGPGVAFTSPSRQAHAYTEAIRRPDDLARPFP
jgi:hypothetical protein